MFCAFGYDAEWDTRVTGWINRVRQRTRAGITPPGEIRDIRLLLDEMRLVKSTEELQIMHQAAEISAHAHRRAMHETKPGMFEYEVEASCFMIFGLVARRRPLIPPS